MVPGLQGPTLHLIRGVAARPDSTNVRCCVPFSALDVSPADSVSEDAVHLLEPDEQLPVGLGDVLAEELAQRVD